MNATPESIIQSEKATMAPRVERLKQRFYATKPSVCIDRDVLYAKAYKENPYDCQEIRRAKAFRYVMDNIPINIEADDLIVGNPSPKIRATAVYPELGAEWLKKDIETFNTREQDPFEVSEEALTTLREDLFPYWDDKNLSTLCLNRIPEVPQEMIREGQLYIYWYENAPGHIGPSYQWLIEKGIDGVKQDAQEKLATLNVLKVRDLKKIDFLKAIIIVCDGMSNYGRRYAEKARQLAWKEKDAKRKAELEQIAQVCDRVPGKPAETFWEVLQFVNFIQTLAYVESKNLSTMLGRLDQYAYPFLVKDMKEGRITKEEAQELLECLYVKIAELVHCSSNVHSKFSPGYNTYQVLSVGGVDRDDNDVTNELSYMCLQATRHVRLHQPCIVAIFSKHTTKEFYDAVLDTLLVGSGGMPAMINVENGSKCLLARGATVEDAREGGAYGCVQYEFLGKGTSVEGGVSNLPADLERTLYNGYSPMAGKVIAPQTGDPRDFRTFDEFLEAYQKQMAFMMDQLVQSTVTIWRFHEEEFPTHLESVVLEGCVKKGVRAKDPYEVGPKYPCFTTILPSGLPTVANSLAAIKKFVYEEKSITMDELVDALQKDFEGYEDMRQMLINDAPKFGNDDDYVDTIAHDLQYWLYQHTKNYKTDEGHEVSNNYNLTNSNVPMGLVVGATPDGRHAQAPLADNLSPAHGTEQFGPTAVFKSVAKFAPEVQGQVLLNMKFSPNSLVGDDRDKVIDMLKAYWELGGYHVQFNVVKPETLQDAQMKPEDHKDLMIRIAGYSAHFTDLQKITQDDIIERTTYNV